MCSLISPVDGTEINNSMIITVLKPNGLRYRLSVENTIKVRVLSRAANVSGSFCNGCIISYQHTCQVSHFLRDPPGIQANLQHNSRPPATLPRFRLPGCLAEFSYFKFSEYIVIASCSLRTDSEIYIDYKCNVFALFPYFGISPLISSRSHI